MVAIVAPTTQGRLDLRVGTRGAMEEAGKGESDTGDGCAAYVEVHAENVFCLKTDPWVGEARNHRIRVGRADQKGAMRDA
jgi:hypothetical protein